MKTLYESILDDEDDILDKMSEIPAEKALRDIMNKHNKLHFLEQGRVKYIKGKGISLPGIDIYNDYSLDIINNPYIDNIYYSDDLSLLNIKNSDITKKEIHIDEVKILRVDEKNTEQLDYKKFKINKIETLYCYITDNESRKTWIELINYFKPENVCIHGWRKLDLKGSTADRIKGLNVNILTIDCDLFKDVIWRANHQKFSPTEANIEILNNIFANNKFKELRIRNFNTVIRYYEVIKAPRTLLGYKLINHR